MAKKAYLFLADGFEEVEAMTPADYLRRAGIETEIVSITKEKIVRGAHNIIITADSVIDACSTSDADAFILPGGMPGAKNLAESAALDTMLRAASAQGKIIAAICAAPAVVLAPKGLLAGKKACCYPGEEKKLAAENAGRITWTEARVTVSDNFITSRAAGTAAEFSFAIIAALCGKEVADKVASAVLF